MFAASMEWPVGAKYTIQTFDLLFVAPFTKHNEPEHSYRVI